MGAVLGGIHWQTGAGGEAGGGAGNGRGQLVAINTHTNQLPHRAAVKSRSAFCECRSMPSNTEWRNPPIRITPTRMASARLYEKSCDQHVA